MNGVLLGVSAKLVLLPANTKQTALKILRASKVTTEGFFRYQINVHSRVMYEPLEHKATI